MIATGTQLNRERDMLKLAREWDTNDEEIAYLEADIKQAERRVAEAKAAVDAMPPEED